MSEPALYLMVGGFLGAGKTTSVIELASYLEKQGKKVGVITNDQAEDLVDTQLVRRNGFDVQEIAGGCFCCRFSSLKEAADVLTKETRPDVFIAEPVGSCTDLVATVSYPLRRMYGDDFRIAPLSVLLDPIRAMRVFGLGEGKRFSEKIEYIYKKQIEESQVIVVNKVDLLSDQQKEQLDQYLQTNYAEKSVYWISAREKSGLESWFDAVTQGTEHGANDTTMEMDYETYAEGEAMLGWLNASLSVHSDEDFDGNEIVEGFCQTLLKKISEEGQVAHLKLTFKPEDEDYELASVQVVDNDRIPELGMSLSEEVEAGELVVNARAEMEPDTLKQALNDTLLEYEASGLKLSLKHMDHFAPAKPVPEYRFEVGVV